METMTTVNGSGALVGVALWWAGPCLGERGLMGRAPLGALVGGSDRLQGPGPWDAAGLARHTVMLRTSLSH